MQDTKSEVKVTYEYFETKKNSVRLKTNERLGLQYPLPDVYVPRAVLRALGADNVSDHDIKLEIVYRLAA